MISSSPHLSSGDAAPDLSLSDDEGHKVRLSDLWRQRPLVLLFVRHFGWPLCREHAVRVRDEYQRFTDAGGQVAMVTMGKPEQARQFREQYKLPFLLLSDPDQAAYRAFHVPRGGILSVAGPGVWAAGAQSLLKHGVGRIIGDPYQLPASFVIDRTGTIAFARRGKTSADIPTNDELVAALEPLK